MRPRMSSCSAEEAAAVATHLKRQVSLQLVGAGLLAMGVVLGGVAVMLWASFPTLNSPWALALTPCVPILAGAIALRVRVIEDRARPVRAITTPTGRRRGDAATGR